jgi:hypothetical protein
MSAMSQVYVGGVCLAVPGLQLELEHNLMYVARRAAVDEAIRRWFMLRQALERLVPPRRASFV